MPLAVYYFTSYRLGMFRTLLCPSLGACDYGVELPHCPFRSSFAVCWRLDAVPAGVMSGLQVKAQL